MVGPPADVEAKLCLVPQNPIYQLYATIVAFYLPLTVILILNTQIYRIARKIINRVSRAELYYFCNQSWVICSPRRRRVPVSLVTSWSQIPQQNISPERSHFP